MILGRHLFLFNLNGKYKKERRSVLSLVLGNVRLRFYSATTLQREH